jgi:hypothetical protein
MQLVQAQIAIFQFRSLPRKYMAWNWDKSKGEYVFNGFEKGMAPSPHMGIANMINVNTSTEIGEVMCSFSRAQQSQIPITSGTFNAIGGANLGVSASSYVYPGTWVSITTTGLGSNYPEGNYYVLSNTGIASFNINGTVQLSSYYVGSTPGTATGSASFSSVYGMGQPIDRCYEKYNSSSGIQYRYYILDSNGFVWVNDTNSGINNQAWFLPDFEGNTGAFSSNVASGIAILNGNLLLFAGNLIFFKPTVCLGNSTSQATTWNPFTYSLASISTNQHTAYVGHQGRLYFTDGQYVGSIFPNTSLLTGIANIQSYAQWSPALNNSLTFTGTVSAGATSATLSAAFPGATGTYVFKFSDTENRSVSMTFNGTAVSWTGGLSNNVTATVTVLPSPNSYGTITTLINGSIPFIPTNTAERIPAIFFTAPGGTLPSAISANTVYWILYNQPGGGDFQVFSSSTSNGPLDIDSGAVGTQYFNTFYPATTATAALFSFFPQNLTLPTFETSQCIAELDNQLVIGGRTNTLYLWNQVDPLPSDIVVIPENNVVKIITVNNMAYFLAGNKGNIYLTSGSSAIPVLTIPDYCAGIAGTPTSYIEPYFIWGDMAFIRGRVFVSVQDETASKAGTCGGIWSFVPTQAMFIQQDQGSGLRMENVNSYATFSNGVYANNGLCTVLLTNQNQAAIAPQFFSGWMSDLVANSPLYGIDGTGTSPSTTQPTVIETDLLPTGNMLDKRSFQKIEWKVSSPLLTNETVTVNYRLSSTGAWTALTNPKVDTSALSGYYTPTFELTQWVQFQIILTGIASSPSFNRLAELSAKPSA